MAPLQYLPEKMAMFCPRKACSVPQPELQAAALGNQMCTNLQGLPPATPSVGFLQLVQSHTEGG